MTRDFATGKRISREFWLQKAVAACEMAQRESKEGGLHRPGSLWLLEDATGASWQTCRRHMRRAVRKGLITPDLMGNVTFATPTEEGLNFLGPFRRQWLEMEEQEHDQRG